MIISNRKKVDSYLTSLTILETLFKLYSEKLKWNKSGNNNGKYFIDLLMGTDKVRKKINKKISPKNIKASWEKDLEKFKVIKNKYLLY